MDLDKLTEGIKKANLEIDMTNSSIKEAEQEIAVLQAYLYRANLDNEGTIRHRDNLIAMRDYAMTLEDKNSATN